MPLPKSEAKLKDIFSKLNIINKDTDVFYTENNSLYDIVLSVGNVIDLLSTALLVVGFIFMVFAALLLLNFIAISVSQKKKEIGILRAIGARGLDVFKIFFAESVVISLICLILAIIGTLVATTVLNNMINIEMGVSVTIFVFGALPILLMIVVAILVCFLGTFMPVYLAARKKPVEAIRAL